MSCHLVHSSIDLMTCCMCLLKLLLLSCLARKSQHLLALQDVNSLWSTLQPFHSYVFFLLTGTCSCVDSDHDDSRIFCLWAEKLGLPLARWTRCGPISEQRLKEPAMPNTSRSNAVFLNSTTPHRAFPIATSSEKRRIAPLATIGRVRSQFV